jgi:hypothetical protein
MGVIARWRGGALFRAGRRRRHAHRIRTAGALTWDYWWWNVRMPWLILLFGYLTFFLVAFWVHDMQSLHEKIRTVAAIYAFDAACLLLFGGFLGWI